MNNFSHIKDKSLRDWNRLNMLYNMKERLGNVFSRNYAKGLGEKGMRSVLALHARVEREGYENIRREICRSIA